MAILPNNLCPYMSHIIDGADPLALDWTDNVVPIPCMENKCKAWDSSNNICKIIDGGILQQIKDIVEHVHDHHRHNKPHIAATTPVLKGSPLTKPGATATSLLVEESGGEDMDGNGYIYTQDFIIDPDDPNLPNMLKNVNIPNDFEGDIILWNEYLDSSSIYSIHSS